MRRGVRMRSYDTVDVGADGYAARLHGRRYRWAFIYVLRKQEARHMMMITVRLRFIDIADPLRREPPASSIYFNSLFVSK